MDKSAIFFLMQHSSDDLGVLQERIMVLFFFQISKMLGWSGLRND